MFQARVRVCFVRLAHMPMCWVRLRAHPAQLERLARVTGVRVRTVRKGEFFIKNAT